MKLKDRPTIRPVWVFNENGWALCITHVDGEYNAWLCRDGVGTAEFLLGVSDKDIDFEHFYHLVHWNLDVYKLMYDADLRFIEENGGDDDEN